MVQGVKLTYEQQVTAMAETIEGDFNSVRGVVIATAAYALSLAHEKSVMEVAADLKAEMKRLNKGQS
jgi:uncharacterized protein YqgV (UPF0045/DUF77 family)